MNISYVVIKYFLITDDLVLGQYYLSAIYDPIYPTPPLGQDMTQGQFLIGV